MDLLQKISTAMALAEEHSRYDFTDDIQDWLASKDSLPYTTDVGPANISYVTAQNVDISPIDSKNKQLAKSTKQTLKDSNATRQLLLTNEGTIFIGLLEMKSMSNKLSPFIHSNMEEYKKAQLNVNAWREGNRIINRIRDNKNKTKDPQSYMPNPGSNLKEYCNNYCRVKDILRNRK